MAPWSLIPAVAVAILATGLSDARAVFGPGGFDIRCPGSQAPLLSLLCGMILVSL